MLLLALVAASCAADRKAATLRKFEATLAAQDSATVALGQWCTSRRIARPTLITATPAEEGSQPEPVDARALLAIGPDAPLGYRHVRLACSDRVLSEAYNWYVPERLTPEMNAALAATHIPFGTVASSLRFTRQRLESRHGESADCPAGTILSHRALLRLPEGQPLALVVECYTSANLSR